jgi:hypothetical protein
MMGVGSSGMESRKKKTPFAEGGFLERIAGLEPATLCLGSKSSTN